MTFCGSGGGSSSSDSHIGCVDELFVMASISSDKPSVAVLTPLWKKKKQRKRLLHFYGHYFSKKKKNFIK